MAINDLDNIELRIDDQYALLGQKPSWLVRWGITIYLGILLLIIIAFSFVSYPDIIKTNALLISDHYCEIRIFKGDLSKVKTGQKVLLKFLAYPPEQYGFVSGKIEFIPIISTDTMVPVKVFLPDGLITNRNKIIPFNSGLIAQGEVIKGKIYLIDRLYHSIFK